MYIYYMRTENGDEFLEVDEELLGDVEFMKKYDPVDYDYFKSVNDEYPDDDDFYITYNSFIIKELKDGVLKEL